MIRLLIYAEFAAEALIFAAMKQTLILLLLMALASCRPNNATEEGATSQAQDPAAPAPTGLAALPPGSNENPFFGKWVSEIDPKEVVNLSSSRFVSTYDNAKMVDKPLAYYDQCPGKCTGQDANADYACFMLIAEESDDANCYAVVKVDENTLEISMIGGAGKTLRYKRANVQ